MAESSIKISLELADRAAQKALSDFIDKGAKGEKSFKKFGDSGKSSFDQIAVSIGKATGIYDIFVGNLAANLATKAFETITAAASQLFNTFIIDGIKAAQAQEDAINSLNVALAQTGIYSKQTSKEIQEFANELQRTTTFEDDVILQNAALIQSLGQLDKEGLKRATQAALDMSAALGIDLKAAATLVGKAAAGEVSSFTRYGVAIQKGTTDAQTFTNALDALESKFGGTAASKVNTYSGAIAQAGNAFGDLQESIGNLIVKNPAVIAVINEVSKIVTELTGNVEGQTSAFTLLVGNGLSLFLEVAAFVVTAADALVKSFQTLYGAIQALATPLLAITVPLNALSVGWSEAKKQADEYLNSTIKNLGAFKEQDGALADTATNLLRLKDAADRGLEAMANGATASVEPINNTSRAVASLTAEAERSQKVLESFALGLVKQAEDSRTALDAQLEIARAKADQEQIILQEQLDNQLINIQEYNTRRAEIDAEFDALRIETDLQKHSADNERLIQARNQNLITEQEYFAAREQLALQFEKNQVKHEAEIAKREAGFRKQQLAQEKQHNQAKIQATADVFGAIGSIAALGGKKNFELVKAFNLAEAITAGVLAIQKAAASAPPPFNVPAIVSATALSAANVARIVATKAPSFEDGGIVPGTSFTGDRVSANVNSGEMILNRSQQATLFKIANGGQSTSGLESKLDTLIGLLASKDDHIVVNIGGRTVVDTLRSELAAGRSFA